LYRRYVLLGDCGCVIESHAMEDHLNRSERHIAMYTCPKCGTIIVNTVRYINRIKIKYKEIVEVNKRVHSLDSKLIHMRVEVQKKLQVFCKYKDESKLFFV